VVRRFYGKDPAKYLGISAGRPSCYGGHATDNQLSDVESGNDEPGEDFENGIKFNDSISNDFADSMA
jgi:hypothetical protein